MRILAFASRNRRELMRDPLTVAFGLGFPLVLLYLLSLLQRNIPIPMFEVSRLAPGVAAFGLTFIALFSAMLVSKDRTRSLMMRLCASPMTARDFILGYLAPLIPLAMVQTAICYLAAAPLGLKIDGCALISLLSLVPAAVMYIAIGLICGTLLTDKQVGGVCGAALTNVCAWLSGIWFKVDLLGNGFAKVANCLPFARAVEAARAAVSGDFAKMLPSLGIVSLWAAGLMTAAIFIFNRRLKSGKI